MYRHVKAGNLIKITGRSYTPIKDKPVYLVVKKEDYQVYYRFLLLDHYGNAFWTNFDKRNPHDNILIIS